MSNFEADPSDMTSIFKNCYSLEILKMNYDQTYKDDYDLRNLRKKCGCGVYLFQDPKIAENSAGIIDIVGY